MKSSTGGTPSQPADAVLINTLVSVVATLLFSFLSVLVDISVKQSIQGLEAYLGIVVVFAMLLVAAAGIAIYVARRPSRARTIKTVLVASYQDALDASALNPRRPVRVRHG
jgi:hypothetical protein